MGLGEPLEHYEMTNLDSRSWPARHAAGRRTALLALCFSSLVLTACDESNDNDKNQDIELAVPVKLETREDVINAVGSVWYVANRWSLAEAPARPLPSDSEATGQVTEDCGTSGKVSYDEDQSITSYDNCTEVTEETDETTGVSTEYRLTLNGNVHEDCLLEEGEEEPTDYRCLNLIPLSSESQKTETTPSETEGEDPSVTTEYNAISENAYLEISAESESGFSLLIDEEHEHTARFTDADGVETESEIALEMSAFELSLSNVGDTETPDYRMDFDGEMDLFTNQVSGCTSGLVRVGTTDALHVQPATNMGPTGGQLVLSTDSVGALAVTFNADSGISFRLAGEDITVSGEEMNGGCFGSFEQLPSDGEETPDECSGVDFGGFFCFPDDFGF